MYLQHFGLRHAPLGKALTEPWDDGALAQLALRFNWLLQSPGIGLITGEPGVGKTAALRSLTRTLNPHRIHQHPQPRRPPPQDVQHVLQGCSGGRSHNRHRHGKPWDGLFPVLLKKPLLQQAPFQSLESRLQGPHARPPHLPDNHLILPPRLIH